VEFATIAVSMIPGQIALTWMPRFESSAFRASLNPTTPYFDAQYGAVFAEGMSPSWEAVLTTEAGRPWRSIRGTKAWTP